MDQEQDALIIEEIRSGNKEAYRILVDRYRSPVYNLALRMTASVDTANDLAQETFVRAYASLHTFEAGRSFFTWIYTICLNLTRNFLQKRREIPLESLETHPQEGDDRLKENPSPEDHLMERQAQDQLSRCLGLLPLEFREPLVLRYIQDLSFQDVARVLGIGVSLAKMRVYRGLEKMKTLMAEEDIQT
jgi:RNA polymerase sigma-70 factor (ECF subfamily)